MSITLGIGTRDLTRVALASCLVLLADAAMAQSIEGTAAYRERMALPPAAVFEATLEDVSRADAPAETIARTCIESPGNPPIAFTIPYDAAKIVANHRYVVRARILVDDEPLFVADSSPAVITRGSPTTVSIMLRRAAGGQTGPPAAGTKPLEGTYWRAIELAGTATPRQHSERQAHLLFQAQGRLTGSDGCNRVTGSYRLEGDAITFGQMIATQMACLDARDSEEAFRAALKNATRLTIVDGRLELADAAGQRVAAFTAGATAPPSPPHLLTGTSWQLVKFQGGDEKTLTPDDRANYTIAFAADGQLTARVDCNRGRATWESSGANQLQFGSLALTRAKCPAGSLHDQIVKQWSFIRSYVIEDGHLFLSLMADGGIYEFEPVAKPKP